MGLIDAILRYYSYLGYAETQVRWKNKGIITIFLCTILFIMMIVSISLKSFLIFKKLEGNPTNINIYERELPSKLKPAHVRMILNDGLIDAVSFAIIFEMGAASKEQIEEFIRNNIYTKKEQIWNNSEELRIIELRNKPMTKDDIEERINNELYKYKLD